MVERFEIFLVAIAAAGEEQDRSLGAPGRKRPVDPADRMAIRSAPGTLIRIRGNCPSIESGGLTFVCLANTSLLTVVTFW
jgi:hypothetical protein